MSDDPEYALLMPFVVCASQCGPYDDASFTAGWECALVDAALAAGPIRVTRTVLTESLPQYDLIAMRHGYRMETGETAIPGWSYVVFLKQVGRPD